MPRLGPQHDTATKAQVLTLKQNGFKNDDIALQTTVSPAQIRRIATAARERGWDLDVKGPIKDTFVERKEGTSKNNQKLIEEVVNKGRDRPIYNINSTSYKE
ncbi:hypothetical protein GQ44DRAFT_762690 [Phaeosphaeriaceae sp. PMI808]|nr:hypothetical protein GQ44DRAFT_762690 [Phaeosphaeriaceae sp. PMI808]